MKKALFYNDFDREKIDDSGEGYVVRTVKLKNGQLFDYNHSVDIDNLACPKCGSNESLVFKGDHPNKVSKGYVGACLNCNKDFYLLELLKADKGNETRVNLEQKIKEKKAELADPEKKLAGQNQLELKGGASPYTIGLSKYNIS